MGPTRPLWDTGTDTLGRTLWDGHSGTDTLGRTSQPVDWIGLLTDLVKIRSSSFAKLAEELPAERLQEFREIFSYFDRWKWQFFQLPWKLFRAGCGSIGSEELNQVRKWIYCHWLRHQVMQTFGWNAKEDELKDMVQVIDQDGNGDISFNEFVWLMTKWDQIVRLHWHLVKGVQGFGHRGRGAGGLQGLW